MPDPDGMAMGEDESPRMSEIFSGRRPAPPPRPKGPKPIIGWKPEDEGPGGGGAEGGGPEDAVGARRGVGTPVAAASAAQRRVPGTKGPEDAWMWEGVPEGRSLIGRAIPGKMRYYMGDDGHGPQFRWLPAAWPPGQGPEDEA